MIKHSIILVMALFICLSVFSETTNDTIASPQVAKTAVVKDTIQYQKAGAGYKFTLNNETLTLDKLEKVLQNNPRSVEYFKKAKSTKGLITVLGYAGGFLVGYPIGTMLGGGKANWTMAAIGCGLLVVAIPIASGADKNILKAVQAYNMDTPVSRKDNREIKLGVNQNGLALALRF